jgi:uncharacterized protein (DUF1697 family)
MAVHVAMLRGINVGGRHRVPMAELRTLLTDAGYEDVRTYVQSGNIVLTSPSKPAEVERDLRARISERFDFDVPVVVRNRTQLKRVIERDPIDDAADDPKRYQVTFLAGKLPADVATRLQERMIESERFVVRGREIYTWHPEGVARSKLAGAIADKGLGVTATARNWTTVTTLLEMASESSGASA